jgi:hypothetical protein
VARVLASAGGWAFTIALALYAYYEDGVTGVALAVAVRTLPAAFAAPHVRSAFARVPERYAFALTAAARALILGAVVLCVVRDFPFWVFLALVAAYRVAGVAQRPARRVEEVGFLAGALATGAAASLWTLDAVFAMCAGVLALAAVVALVSPVPAHKETVSASIDQRRLHLVRGARAAARSAVELLLVIAALDLLGMGIAGVGWLSAAWAAGLLAGLWAMERRAIPDPVRAGAASLALIGIPLALLALSPPDVVAFVLLGVVGVGLGLGLRLEHAIGGRPGAVLAGEELVDAVARTTGATAAAVLVVVVGDAAALAVAGAAAAAIGIGALALSGAARGREPVAARH